jgi:hypothetical protein
MNRTPVIVKAVWLIALSGVPTPAAEVTGPSHVAEPRIEEFARADLYIRDPFILPIHQPNSGESIRMRLLELEDRGDTLRAKREIPFASPSE